MKIKVPPLISFYDGKSKRLGLDFFVLSSGLQKSIRRGLVDDAMIYAREFAEAGQFNYLWKRILVMVVEDIGLANPYIGKYVLDNYELYASTKTIEEYDATTIYKTVYALAKSVKNRENDSMINLVRKFDGGSVDDKSVIERYCLEDFAKKKSKKIKSQLTDMLVQDFSTMLDQDYFETYTTLMTNLMDLNGDSGIFLYPVNFYLASKYGIGNNYLQGYEEWLSLFVFPDKYSFISLSLFEIKDVVYDKHTVEGKRLGRGLKHFFLEGGKIENEVDVGGNIYLNDLLKFIL